MTTITDKNVHLIGVDGTSDELDVPILHLMTNKTFKQQYNISSINSINIARIIVQLVHFFYPYTRLVPNADKSIAFT